MIKAIVVDDHHIVRQGIRALLEKTDEITVIGEAQDGQEALALVKRTPPDVVVCDIAMPRLNGIQLIRQIKTLGVDTKVVILSMYSDNTLVQQALKSGASGYLLKRSVVEELLLAVRSAIKGDFYISPEISKSIVERFVTRDDTDREETIIDRLTPRESQILQLVTEGYSNTKIGKMLNLSSKTVEKHRASLMAKLGVRDLAGLMRLAIKHRLIIIEE
jgi:DNA-binding NarL/FixJ family response regulator